MHGYRAYFLGLDNIITNRIDLYCDNDVGALRRDDPILADAKFTALLGR